MSVKLKPHPAMKDSGVPWLGEVPEHWRQLPGRSCFAEKRTPNTGLRETTVLSLSYGQIVVKPPEKLHGLVPASFETYQLIELHDIVIRPTDLQNDWNSLRFGIAKTRGIITSAYMCFRTRELLQSEFGHLLLHTYDLKKVFYGLGSGLRQNLDWRDFKYLPCVVPPLPEQSAIVRFLDHADRRIRRYIRAKQKLIKLLEEQRQAIIHRAVTRGLDPNVRLKPSGAEWLGDVPEHWEVRKLRSLFRRHGSGTTPAGDAYYGGGIPWIMTGDLTDTVVSETKRSVTKQALMDVSALRLYPAGSLAVAMYGATIGKTGVFGMEACTNQACCVLAHPLATVNVRFVQAVVVMAKGQLIQQSYGGGQPNINAEIVRSLRIPVPTRDEQDHITRAISDKAAALDAASQRASAEISLLREYRTRLTADVVTGKLDVRGVAASLPDETEEPEAFDEGEATEAEETTDTDEAVDADD
jgi:type I restriction enzyme S subunit